MSDFQSNNKTSENESNNLCSVGKRKPEKEEGFNTINKAPKSKLKLRESISEKEKREKFYTCNSNDVLYFKISNLKNLVN